MGKAWGSAIVQVNFGFSSLDGQPNRPIHKIQSGAVIAEHAKQQLELSGHCLASLFK
jgi:hypothetical protein